MQPGSMPSNVKAGKQTLKAKRLLSSQNSLFLFVKPPCTRKPHLLPQTAAPWSCCYLLPMHLSTPYTCSSDNLCCFHSIPGNFQVKHPPLSAQDKALVPALLSLWRRAAEAVQLMTPILAATASLGKHRECVLL